MEKQESEIKNKEKEPKIYCCFSNNENGVEQVLGLAFKVASYIRLSREDGDKQESESIGNQRKIIQRYAKENNLVLVKEYVDDGVSGTTFNRAGFNNMI